MLRVRRRLLAAGFALAAGASAIAQERVVRVSARKFEFSPNDIELVKGEPVVLELTSTDVLMGFSLPGFKLRADIPPGVATRLRFTPDRVGTFEFVCDNFCGEFHEDMSGTIRVRA